MAARTGGAENWSVQTGTAKVTASILRVASTVGKPSLYRMVIGCETATGKGEMQLAWSPSPKTGTLSVVFDGNGPVEYTVEGREKMGNGSPITTGPAAFTFPQTVGVPRATVRASGLFPGEAVEFPFSELPATARESLSTCFR